MSIKLTITDQMQQVAREHGKTLAPLNDDLALLDSGLDSLGIAVLVARLEDRLGVDPFTASEDVQFPVTVGDFVKAYENAAAPVHS
jgi:acyl carrier protein